MVRHCDRLPSEVVESTSLELFKKPAGVALADMGFGGLGSAGRTVGLDLGGLL